MSNDRKEYYKEYYKRKKEELSKKYFDNKDEILEKRKEYYEDNKEKISEYNKKYREENLESLKEYNSNYYLDNRDVLLEKQKEYTLNNKESYRKYQREYASNRVKVDDIFRLSKNVRALIKKSFFIKNNTKTTEIIGCSIEYFKIYLESKFEDWMTWDNWGLYNGELNYGWDIDHIIPLSTGKNEEEVLKLNHYTNLQPLCSKVNRYIKRNLQINSSCLFCGNELQYVKYCNDNCRKKYYRTKKENI
jgi:hypothetical protein